MPTIHYIGIVSQSVSFDDTPVVLLIGTNYSLRIDNGIVLGKIPNVYSGKSLDLPINIGQNIDYIFTQLQVGKNIDLPITSGIADFFIKPKVYLGRDINFNIANGLSAFFIKPETYVGKGIDLDIFAGVAIGKVSDKILYLGRSLDLKIISGKVLNHNIIDTALGQDVSFAIDSGDRLKYSFLNTILGRSLENNLDKGELINYIQSKLFLGNTISQKIARGVNLEYFQPSLLVGENIKFDILKGELLVPLQNQYDPPPNYDSLSELIIDPTSATLDSSIATSNPTTGLNNSDAIFYSGGNSTPYKISSYKLENVSFDGLPDPAVPPSSAVWKLAQAFYEAGTVWLILENEGSTINGNDVWRFRPALYKLNITTKEFEYQNTNLKNYNSASWNDSGLCRIFKTPTGTSIFIRSNNNNPQPNTYTSARNGLLRFEIKSDGTFLEDFILDSQVPQYGGNLPTLNKVIVVFGNKVYVDVGFTNLSINKSLGIINGLEYLTGNYSSIISAFPLSVDSTNPNNETTIATEPYNWRRGENLPYRQIIHNNQVVEEWFRVGAFQPEFTYYQQNQDGSILARAYLNSVCADSSCTNNSDPNLGQFYTFFSIPEYNSVPEKLARVKRSPVNSEATYDIQQRTRTSTVSRINGDKNGNALYGDTGDRIFYKGGESYGVNIDSLINETLYCNEGNSPYGFIAVGSTSNNVFFANSINVYFVQPRLVN